MHLLLTCAFTVIDDAVKYADAAVHVNANVGAVCADTAWIVWYVM